VTFATTIKKPEGTGTSLTNLLFPRIGSDESGKGDYFGPLVTAAVFLDVKTQDYLLRIGVKDSKALSDQVIEGLARKIKQETLSSVISIGPERYNDLYPKMRSVNRLLGWTHARAIENLLEQLDAVYQMGERPEIVAIADQFGDESFIKRALMEKGRSIELRQMPKAEADLAVAAASILARDEFVRRLDWLGKDVGMNLPKGASEKVVEAGRVIVSRFGSQKLALVAKLHFKTTDQVRAFR
jgi:ribonuclease HIII